MLSSQHMAHMMEDHSHLENKQEPTIMSDTLNQRLIDLSPFAQQLEYSAQNTPSIIEIRRTTE